MNAAEKALARRIFYGEQQGVPFGFIPTVYPRYRANWHHKRITDALTRVEAGLCDRLLISMPPRQGKTFTASELFPAWYLGRNPARKIIATSATATAADRVSLSVQRVLNSTRYKEVFPDFAFGRSVTATGFELEAGGRYMAAGSGKMITGSGANLLLIDDPHKNREDADSQTMRDKVWDWYSNDALSRLEYPNAVIIIATRWHHDDLIGRLLLAEPHRWEHLFLPFLAGSDPAPYDPRSEGEVLWRGFLTADGESPSEEELDARFAQFIEEHSRDSYKWASLYQCQPSPKDGGLFRRDCVQYYTAPPSRMADLCDRLVISVDASFKAGRRSDPVAIVVAGKIGPTLHIIEEVNRRMSFTDTKRELQRLRHKYPAATILIEEKANGTALIDVLQGELARVLGFDPGNMSKEARAHLLSDWWSSKQVRLPTHQFAPWVGEYIEDFVGFGSRKHDDRVDALSQAAHYFEGKQNPLQSLQRVVGDFVGSAFMRR